MFLLYLNEEKGRVLLNLHSVLSLCWNRTEIYIFFIYCNIFTYFNFKHFPLIYMMVKKNEFDNFETPYISVLFQAFNDCLSLCFFAVWRSFPLCFFASWTMTISSSGFLNNFLQVLIPLGIVVDLYLFFSCLLQS